MRFGLGCVIAVGLSLSSAGMADARSKAQAEGFGYVRADGVTLARVKEVEKTLKGCGINLGGLVGVVSPYGRTRQTKCNPNKKEYQPFGIWEVRQGERVEIAMRTRSPLTQAAFKGQQSLNMSLPKGNSRACFVIGTRKGNKLVPVPVRSGRGDKFLFSNPLAYTAALKSNAYADWQAKEKALQGDESNWQTTYNRLLRNPAYDRAGKQCTTPAMGRIPPKPNVMSWEASELQANGQCVNLISARWRYTQVADAMAAIAEDGIMDEHSRWKRGGNKASCARKGALYSQSVDWVGGLCSVFGVSGERDCIQNLVKACKKRVHDECRGGLAQWERTANSIRSKPGQLRRSCQADRQAANNLNYAINSGQTAELAKAKAYYVSLPSAPSQYDLGQATCGASS